MKFLHIFLLIPLIQSINLFQLAENLQPQPHTSNFDDQIQFLPRFHQVQTQNSQLKLLTKFLIDDDEILKDNNGIYDETGRDGIDPSEENFPFDSEENINQRVRSSSMLWIKQNSKFAKYEAYGSSENDEKLNGWTIKTVLLMNGHGDHILKKVCLSQKEKLISFVLDMDEMCKEKIHIAEEFEEKENNFFPKTKKGFAGLAIPSLDLKRNIKRPDIKFIPLDDVNSKENYENDENEEILEGKIIELQKKLDEIRRKNHKISKITTNITAIEPRFTQKEEENNNNIEKDSTKMLLDLLDEKINN